MDLTLTVYKVYAYAQMIFIVANKYQLTAKINYISLNNSLDWFKQKSLTGSVLPSQDAIQNSVDDNVAGIYISDVEQTDRALARAMADE